MTERRFTIGRSRGGYDLRRGGWAVFDRGEQITITFATFAEAERRRDNIQALYARFGFC